MASANQSSGLDQYPDPDNVSAAAVNETLGYDGTAIAMQMMLHPVCLYLTAVLLSNHAAPVPQNCTLLDRTSIQLCVSAFGDNINILLFLSLSPCSSHPPRPFAQKTAVSCHRPRLWPPPRASGGSTARHSSFPVPGEIMKGSVIWIGAFSGIWPLAAIVLMAA